MWLVWCLVRAFLWAGAQCLEHDLGASLDSDIKDLPWQDELCCDSPSAYLNAEEDTLATPESNHTKSNFPRYPRCSFRSSTTKPFPTELSGGKGSFTAVLHSS